MKRQAVRQLPCWLVDKHSHDRSGRYCYVGLRLTRLWWMVVDRITGRRVRCTSLKQARLWMVAARGFDARASGL